MRSPPWVGSALVLAVVAGSAAGFGCSSTSGGKDGGGGAAGTGSGGSAGGGAGAGHDGGSSDAHLAHDGAGTSNGPCWSASDCTSGAFCAIPGQQLCGGACIGVTHPCSADTDCASGDAGAPSICDPVPCSCPAGKACRPGCGGDGDCGPESSCAGDHRCAPRACTAASGSCPTDFICGSTGTCGRKGCTLDTECSNACVEGACYGTPGTCRLPAP